MSQGPTLKMKKRLNYGVITAIMLVFAITTTSVFDISVLHHDDYLARANNQQLRPETIPANRGTIYDRNMQVIARSATVWDVVLSPVNMVEYQKADIARELSKVLISLDSKITEEYILAKTKKTNQYEIVTKKVEKETVDKIRDLIIKGSISPTTKKTEYWKGIDLVENTKRYYPNSTLAASVIGFTGTDSQGLYGIEKYYDEALTGTPGYIVTAKNGIGENMPVNYEEKFPAKDGNGLVLTIDETIQHFLEKTLDQVEAQHNPKQGSAGIVMNVNTGEILAMANRPTFDLNQPFTLYDPETVAAISALPEAEQKDAQKAARDKQWQNKAVTDTYEPGSTFKTLVTAAALEEKTTSLNTTFYCPGHIDVAKGVTMKCHKAGGHGQLDFTGALVNSCNPAFVKIGASLGAFNFYKYFSAFGLTEKTGIDLPGEGKSQFYTADKLTTVSLASCSFGQSMTLTPMQLVTAVSSAVNGGNLVTPHVVKDFLDADNNIISSVGSNIKRQVVSEETSKQLRVMMEAVVDVKGGTNASIKGYRIGGKSGTSQKLNQPDKEARIASYIAVAPVNKPEIAVYVMVDEPTSGDVYGSVIAAPAVANIMRDTLPYLGYNPSYNEEEVAKLEVAVPYMLKLGVLEAQSKLSAVGLSKAKVIGEGNTVVKQVPSVGSKMPKDGIVYLYTESENETMVPVPNVVGLSPTQAKNKLQAANFNVTIKGEATDHANSKIISQNIKEGIMTPIGTVVEITCIKSDTD